MHVIECSIHICLCQWRCLHVPYQPACSHTERMHTHVSKKKKTKKPLRAVRMKLSSLSSMKDEVTKMPLYFSFYYSHPFLYSKVMAAAIQGSVRMSKACSLCNSSYDKKPRQHWTERKNRGKDSISKSANKLYFTIWNIPFVFSLNPAFSFSVADCTFVFCKSEGLVRGNRTRIERVGFK